MARSRPKPKSPEQIAKDKLEARQRDLEAVNIPADFASLAVHENIGVTRAGASRGTQKAGQDGARRQDVFDALRPDMQKDHYNAARQLCDDITKSRGEHDRGRAMFRVDNDGPEKDRMDAMIAASSEVKRALGCVGNRDSWLLMELIVPSLGCFESGWKAPQMKGETKEAYEKRQTFFGWRATVAYITGESHLHAQGAAVRSACANLAQAYDKHAKAA